MHSESERDPENYALLGHPARTISRGYQIRPMPDKTSDPKPTEKKRAPTVRDLKPKIDPKGGAGKSGKSDNTFPRKEEVDFNL